MNDPVEAFKELAKVADGHWDDIDAAKYVEYQRSDEEPPGFTCCGQSLECFYVRCPTCKKSFELKEQPEA